jgi:hypothetical protein
MKKTLNLAIETGRIEELNEIHEKLAREMESDMAQIVQGNDITEFSCTISNPVSVKTKGRKSKNVNGMYKGKIRQMIKSNQNKENVDENYEELSNKRLQRVLHNNSNTGTV